MATLARVFPGCSLASRRPFSYSFSGEEWVEADCKPGSVEAYASGDHLSRTPVSRRLQRPLTRGLDEQPLKRPPIWSCSERGLPCRPVTRPPVSSYLTISPLPSTGSGDPAESAV